MQILFSEVDVGRLDEILERNRDRFGEHAGAIDKRKVARIGMWEDLIECPGWAQEQVQELLERGQSVEVYLENTTTRYAFYELQALANGRRDYSVVLKHGKIGSKGQVRPIGKYTTAYDAAKEFTERASKKAMDRNYRPARIKRSTPIQDVVTQARRGDITRKPVSEKVMMYIWTPEFEAQGYNPILKRRRTVMVDKLRP